MFLLISRLEMRTHSREALRAESHYQPNRGGIAWNIYTDSEGSF